MNIDKPIKTAEFSPKIKTYVILVVAALIPISVFGIPLLLVWFLGLGQSIGRRYHENLECELTLRHLRFKKGVFFKVEKTIPLENIQDLTFIENQLLDLLELKILKVETAGNSSSTGSDMKLIGILEADNFKNEVLSQRDLLTSGQSNSSIENAEFSDDAVELLREIRDLLKAQSNA